MPSLGKAFFTGQSGRTYRFRVFALGTRFRNRSGVYALTSRTRNTNGGPHHVVLYVGQTADFSQPLAQHCKADAARQRGADCICVLSDDSEESRLAKEKDLIAAFHPACND
jgi:hypothetical protein